MRKILLKTIMIFLFVTIIFNVKVFAADFTYELSGNNAIITAYTGSNSTVTIPGTIDGHNVTGIKAHAFNSSRNSSTRGSVLRNVTISDGVSSIGLLAFNGCSNLQRVTLPESLTDLGAQTFLSCSSLTSINIPSRVTTIGDSVFQESGLTEITIPSNVTEIQSAAFRICRNLKTVNVYSNNVRYVSSDVFEHCASDLVLYGAAGSTTETYARDNNLTFRTLTDSNIRVTRIELNRLALSLARIGESFTLTTTVTPNNATNKNVTWSSNNTGVATVDSSGKVTAVANGTAIVTATAADGSGESASCTVTVTAPIRVTGITLSKTEISLTSIGSSSSITATITPSNASNKSILWTSSNTEVATVTSLGRVTAVSGGTATITATAADGSGVSATCSVTVSVSKRVTGVSLNKTSETLTTSGATCDLVATVTPSDASVKTVDWTSSNPGVATVSSQGRVTAVSNGTTIITAASTDGSNKFATCTITVSISTPGSETVKITGITLNKTSHTFTSAGATLGLSATITPSNATLKTLTWSSSNSSVAIVSTNGMVTAVGNGTATITASAQDGSGKSARCTITVSISTPAPTPNPPSSTLPFRDVASSSWYYDAVKYCYDNGIIMGTSDTTYSPNQKTTRAMLVTILWRMEGEPSVTGGTNLRDLNSGAYYYNAVLWAEKNGVVNGYEDGTFKPNGNVTRQQLAVLLCNYAKFKRQYVEPTNSLTAFTDNAKVASYALDSIKWAVNNEVISGKTKNGNRYIEPNSQAMRSELAGMIYNYCSKINN